MPTFVHKGEGRKILKSVHVVHGFPLKCNLLRMNWWCNCLEPVTTTSHHTHWDRSPENVYYHFQIWKSWTCSILFIFLFFFVFILWKKKQFPDLYYTFNFFWYKVKVINVRFAISVFYDVNPPRNEITLWPT